MKQYFEVSIKYWYQNFCILVILYYMIKPYLLSAFPIINVSCIVIIIHSLFCHSSIRYVLNALKMIKKCVRAVVVMTSPKFLINGLVGNFLDRQFDVRIVSANGKENCLILRNTLVESAFMLQSYVNMDVVNTTIVIHYQSMNRMSVPIDHFML